MGLISLYQLNNFSYISKMLIKILIMDSMAPSRIFQLLRAAWKVGAAEKQRQRLMKIHQTPIPSVCILSVTQNCNLSCKGCYATIHPGDQQSGLQDIEHMIRRVMNYGTSIFVITGGEPLLVDGLIPALGRIRQGTFLIFTNGILIKDGMIRQIKTYKNIMPVFSLEGSDHLTDQRRGPGTALALKSAALKLKHEGVLFGLSVTLTQQNLSTLTSGDLMADAAISGATFMFIIDYVHLNNACNDMHGLSEEDQKLKARSIEKLRKKSRTIILNMPGDESENGRCAGGGKGLIFIGPTGNVSPCPFITEMTDNILEKDFIKILKSEELSAFREKAGENEKDGSPCIINRDCHL
jgi:MoaA/NifB/PqqE/SkfB family radical SAM enzyme